MHWGQSVGRGNWADTLRAVLRAVKQYEPRELVVTGGAGAAETDEVFRLAGLMEVGEAFTEAAWIFSRTPHEDDT
jgi:putative NADH-flavin reductase